jgi:hypothetical protein
MTGYSLMETGGEREKATFRNKLRKCEIDDDGDVRVGEI